MSAITHYSLFVGYLFALWQIWSLFVGSFPSLWHLISAWFSFFMLWLLCLVFFFLLIIRRPDSPIPAPYTSLGLSVSCLTSCLLGYVLFIIRCLVYMDFFAFVFVLSCYSYVFFLFIYSSSTDIYTLPLLAALPSLSLMSPTSGLPRMPSSVRCRP